MLFRYSAGSCELHDEEECLTTSRVLDVDKVKRQLRHYVPSELSETPGAPSPPDVDIVSRLFSSTMSYINRHIFFKFSKPGRPFVFIIKLPHRRTSSSSANSDCTPPISPKKATSSPPRAPRKPSVASVTMDDYFLDRIETYSPVLQQMGQSSGSSPVVFVTNWQNVDCYPAEWVVRFKKIVARCLHPTPVYIESYGTDEETEDILMGLVQEALPNRSCLSNALSRSKLCKPFRVKENWILPARPQRYWPYMVLILFMLIFIFRNSLLPSPPASSAADSLVPAEELFSGLNNSKS